MNELTAMQAQWEHLNRVFDELFAPVKNIQVTPTVEVEEEDEPTEEELQIAYNDLYQEAIGDKYIMGDIVTHCPKNDWAQIAEAFRTYNYCDLGLFIHARMTVAAKEYAEENKRDLAKNRKK